MIGPLDVQTPQQVRVDLVLRMRETGPGPRVDGFQPHSSHQTLNALTVDFVAQSAQIVPHRSGTPCWVLQVLLVDKPHQLQTLGLDRLGLIIERRTLKSQKPALPGDAQFAMFMIDHLLSLLKA